MKTGKRIISLMLCAIMVFGMFSGVDFGIESSIFDLEASAAEITLGGITQKRVVSNYESLYAQYQARFFTGTNSNSPTNFVIPGLSSSNDYTPQGMTYWEEKEWILISAYDASGQNRHSVVYAIDAVTTEFVALFKILNANGSVNTSHGGGIAASKYNFYYADTGSNISYFPLSELDVPNGTVKEVRLRGSINCGGELGGAATSYCCYEDGVLWAGNFYYSGDDRYKTKPHSNAESMIVGYELHGNSSEEEWYYLSKGYNYVNLTNSTSSQTSGAMTFTTSYTGGKIMIAGKITTDTAISEITPTFASMKLTEGKKYIIEFTSNNNLSDMYMFAPNGTHCNVKQSQQTTITPLENGYYHYSMIFTAGLKPAGADSSWPSTQSTNGAYTGTYTIRFDQDNIPAGGRDFIIKDFAVMEYDSNDSFDANPLFEGSGCAGNPTHVILFPGMDKFQYAMVYKGRIYISRSWKRTSGDNHTRELMVGNLDTSSTGTSNLVINGRTRPCYVLSLANMTRYGGDNGNNNGTNNPNKMFYMGEALCVMNDNLYMFGEGAAWAYNGKESSKCDEPIDVIWKIDQHALMGEERSREDVALSHYEKVWSLEELNTDDEYIIVYESELTDPVTQKNIIYAIDAFGGYGAKKLPKQDEATQANSGDSMGIVGYSITTYNKSEDGNTLYIEAEDDANRSIRWKINASNIANSQANIRISNTDMYYAKYKNLYFGSRLISMRTDSGKNLNKVKAITYGDGKFNLFYEGEVNYFLWCNDGSNQSYIDIYENYYSTHGKVGYTPAYHGLEEKPGTFHGDGLYYKDDVNSGNLMHQAVDTKYREFYIYKRVADVYADTYESRVYTDLDAELQPDGTYTVNLETYAIGTTQYKVLDKQRPTDFIFVLDTSGSMSENDSSGYEYKNSNLDLRTAAGESGNNIGNNGVYGTYTNGRIYYQHPTDGTYCKFNVEISNRLGDGGCTPYYKNVWLYYTHNGTTYWYKPNDPSDTSKGGSFQTSKPSDDEAIKAVGNNDGDRAGAKIYSGIHYVNYAQGSTGCPRLDSMKNAVNGLTYKIANEANSSGLDHRIAVVQYGSNSSGSWTNMGMYTNTGTTKVNYTGAGTISATNYKNAFHSVSQFGNVRNIINNLSASGDTYVDSGMDMAYNIIKNSDSSYLADGNRSACIIMITDGCPGVGGNDSATANTVANAAIQNAYKAKDAGAYVYTVQMGNNSMSGFDMGTYMDNLSSEFISAQSMTDSGDRNVKEINYRLDVPVGSGFNLDTLVNNMFNSVTSNSRNALVKLNASSLLHAEITDAFDLTNADVAVKFAPAAYDGLDRLYFKDEVAATGVTASYNETAQTIDVSGYDYSLNHVSRSNVDKKQANKLVVTFTGVVPNVDAELNNTNINNTESTAIYQNAGGMEFKKFPTEHFSLPEYTYVLDFGVNMLDTDVNGTLQSVDFLPRRQTTYKNELNTTESDAIISFANGNQDLVYSLQPDASGDEARSRGYVLIKRDDGTYDWFRINVVPASNVLYEENSASSSGSGVAWKTEGTAKNSYQSLTSVNDVYGYDPVYNNNVGKFSNGSAYNAIVSSSNNKSATLKFDYTGSAVDIVSACGPKTGIQVISIKRQNGSIEKAYIVDTYYTDTAHLDNNILSQVPIVHHENKDGYGTYTVEVTAAYLSSMVNARPLSARSLYSANTVNFYSPDVKDMAAEAVLSILGMEDLLDADIEVLFADENSVLNGGTGATAPAISTFALTREADRDFNTLNNYFDGFRVYNPLGDMSGDYIESEQGATYYNVINSLASSDDIVTGTGDNLVAYVEGNTNETINFADYASAGSKAPMNEVYLNNQNSGISFNVAEGYQKIMISLRAVSGSPKAKIGDKQFDVLSSTEMYYDITDYVQNGSVTVQNIGNGLLSVCNIKVVNGGLMPMMMSALPRMRMMMAMPSEDVVPNQPPVEEPVINPDLMPDYPVENPDPDLDVEGEIPNYIPDTNESDIDESPIVEFINVLKSFFDRIVSFFKSLFTVMGGK